MQEGSREHKFQAKMDELKDPAPYLEKYATPETRQLVQAIDIVTELRREVQKENQVAYDKLLKATQHLESLLKQHLEADKE